MGPMTFGQALGNLVRLKRRTQGLTQLQLSEDAFGTAAKVRRISELESGLVSNPHPRTIDPIISALHITEAEIEECAKSAASVATDDLAAAYQNAMALIDSLAQQFEHEQPSAGLVELDRFLRTKAAEWSALRARIHQIDAEENELANIRKNAELALAAGHLDRVDALLFQAEVLYQRSRTLAEIQKMASLRISRGDVCLLKGDGETALDLYRSGVELFRAFDETEMIREINEIAHRVYESSHRSLRPIFFVSAALLELLLTLPSVGTDRRLSAEAQYRLGLSYRNEYDDPRSRGREVALEKAIHYSKSALALSTVIADPHRTMVCTIGLANCLRDRAKFKRSHADLLEALELLKKARASCGDANECAPLLPHLLNSLGAILQRAQTMGLAIPDVDLNEEALAAFKEAVVASEEHSNPEVWGAARLNIGALLAEKAAAEDLETEESYFLRLRAIAEFNAAIETYPATGAFPFRFAEAQRALGQVLFQHATAMADFDLAEAYLLRAVQAFEVAAKITDADRRSQTWAHIQVYVGAIFAYHSQFAEFSIALGDIDQAIARYEAAASTFEETAALEEKNACEEAIQKIKLKRRELLQDAAAGE